MKSRTGEAESGRQEHELTKTPRNQTATGGHKEGTSFGGQLPRLAGKKTQSSKRVSHEGEVYAAEGQIGRGRRGHAKVEMCETLSTVHVNQRKEQGERRGWEESKKIIT